MTRLNVAIANCQTGEVVVREMNDEEYAQFLLDQEAAQADPTVEETNDEG